MRMAIEVKNGEQILREKYSPIFMRYVPTEVALEFRTFANENSAGHYGTALRMLLDALKWKNELAELSARVELLESTPKQPDTTRKMPKTIGDKQWVEELKSF